jgi:DNA invertase Pin-like site-specific DNA recombinase
MKIQEIKATKPSKGNHGNRVDRLRVAAYCRVSTDDLDQLNSYDSQIKHYTNYINEKKEWHFAGMYADASITGTQVTKRLDFLRLINDALNGDIDMVITKSISRFARNTYDTLKYVRMLKEKGVAVFFEEENINTMTMDGELLLTILSSVAQQEVENISENVKKGLKMKMKRGELVGFQGCMGYDYDKQTKSISVNYEQAEVVSYIFERYVSGFGATIISRELNERGIKTQMGNGWTNGSIIRIIKNEKYAGDLLMGKSFTVDPISKRRLSNNGEEDKYFVENHHEPIVDRETFDNAQKLLEKRSYQRQPKGSNATREKYSRKYAFSSKLECGFCKSYLSRRAWHSSTKYMKVIWQCMLNTKKGKKNCEHSKGIPEEIVESAFLESYAMISGKDKELVDSFVSRVEKTLGIESVAKKLKTLERSLDEILKKKKKLLNLRLEEQIDKTLFENAMYELADDEKELKGKIEEHNLKLEYEQELERRINSLKKALNNDIKLVNFDRHIFESLIEKVIIGKTDENGAVDPYNITFIYKTGLDNTVNGEKYRLDGRKKDSNVLPSNSTNEVTLLPPNRMDERYRSSSEVDENRLISLSQAKLSGTQKKVDEISCSVNDA